MMTNKRFLLIAFCVQLAFTILYFKLTSETYMFEGKSLTFFFGDAEEYISSVESLIDGNGFVFEKVNQPRFQSNFLEDKETNNGIYYAYRTPGFAFFYYPLRLLFDQNTSLVCLLVIQVLLNALSKTLIVKYVYDYSKSRIISLIPFILSIVVYLYSYYNSFYFTESLGYSFFTLALYYLFKQLNVKDKKSKFKWLISGGFFVLAIHLRPFLFLPFLGSILLMFLVFYKELDKKFIKVIFTYLLPLIIVSSLWGARNYVKTDRVIFLADTMNWTKQMNKSLLKQIDLAVWMGQPSRWWNGNSIVNWFLNDGKKLELKQFPEKYRDEHLVIKLFHAKKGYQKSIDTSGVYTTEEKKKFEQESYQLLCEIEKSLYQKNPMPKQFLISRYNLIVRSINFPNYYGFPKAKIASFLFSLNVYLIPFVMVLLLVIAFSGLFFLKNVIIQFLSGTIVLLYFFFTIYHGGVEYREYMFIFWIGLYLLPLYLFSVNTRKIIAFSH